MGKAFRLLTSRSWAFWIGRWESLLFTFIAFSRLRFRARVRITIKITSTIIITIRITCTITITITIDFFNLRAFISCIFIS